MNWETIIVAAVVSLPPTLVGVATLIKTLKTGKAVDGRLTELLALTRKSAADEATLTEKRSQTERTDAFLLNSKKDG